VLAERAGIEIVETSTDAERREANAARRFKDDLYAVNNLAALFFERCLHGGAGGQKAHPLSYHARDELSRRGLSLLDEGEGHDRVGEAARLSDTLQAFRIGYAPYGWDGLATFLKQQGISPVLAERVGLLVPRKDGSGYYDRFRHRLMFAVSDVMGRVIAFSGRALPEPSSGELAALKLAGPAPSLEPPAKYINSPESPIYTKGEHLFGLYQARHAIRQSGEAILVEGNFDVVSLHARGVSNAIAPLGTAFTTTQAKLLKRFAPSVIILFDGDAAGRKATAAARVPCREGGLSARVATLPAGVDPDDFIQKHGAPGVQRLVQSARGMLEHLIDQALDGDSFRGSSLNEQHARIQAVARLLRDENDPSLRAMAKVYADRLSSKLVILGRSPTDLRQLEALIERSTAGTEVPEPTVSQTSLPHDRARSRPQVDAITFGVLGSLLDFPELLADPEVTEMLTTLDGDAALTVAAMRQCFGMNAQRDMTRGDLPSGVMSNKGIYADEFLAQIPRSIHPFAIGRLASPIFELASEAKVELLENARKLRRLSLSREHAAEVDELHRVEAQGDVDSEMELLRRIARRAREKQGLA